MSDMTFVISRVITMDGFTYTISVYHKPDGYFAFWECQQCGHQSTPTVSAATRDAAIADCKALLTHHHNERHTLVANA